jgi:hypothetical protein
VILKFVAIFCGTTYYYYYYLFKLQIDFYPVTVYYNKTQHTNNTPHSNNHSTQNDTNNKGLTKHNEYCSKKVKAEAILSALCALVSIFGAHVAQNLMA